MTNMNTTRKTQFDTLLSDERTRGGQAVDDQHVRQALAIAAEWGREYMNTPGHSSDTAGEAFFNGICFASAAARGAHEDELITRSIVRAKQSLDRLELFIRGG